MHRGIQDPQVKLSSQFIIHQIHFCIQFCFTKRNLENFEEIESYKIVFKKIYLARLYFSLKKKRYNSDLREKEG